MTKRKDIYTVDNIDAKNKIVSDIINQRYRFDPVDSIRHKLAAVKDMVASTGAPNQLVGIMLWSTFMSFEKFRIKYENMTSLYKEVTDNGSKIGPNNTVREAFVHIPEMTGMLPYPDFSIIKEYQLALRESVPPTDNFEQLRDKCYIEFDKILMYPRFYSVILGTNGEWAYNEPCIVESLGKTGMNSEVLGKFIKVVPSKLKSP